jgi:hypothetical protein
MGVAPDPSPRLVPRVPGGTVGTVTALARDGRWLQVRLADARTGWFAGRYVGCTIAGSSARSHQITRNVGANR